MNKLIALEELEKKGYVLELNRNFLHLLGLSLAIYENELGEKNIVVEDYRNAIAGPYYDIENLDKECIGEFRRAEEFVIDEMYKRLDARQKELSNHIEPIPYSNREYPFKLMLYGKCKFCKKFIPAIMRVREFGMCKTFLETDNPPNSFEEYARQLDVIHKYGECEMFETKDK